MGFNTINIHCNVPPGYMIISIPTNVLYQNLTKNKIEYIEFRIKDEYGRPINLMEMY